MGRPRRERGCKSASSSPVTVKVRVPSQLRSLTDGTAVVEVDPGTVLDVLEALDERYPGLAERVVDGDGVVRRFVNVYVAELDIRTLDGLTTDVADGVTVSIISSVAGG